MKRLVSIFLVACCISSAYGQMDERFYFPEKEWKPITGLSYSNHFIQVEKDSISYLNIAPHGASKNTTILYFHGGGGNNSTHIDQVIPLVNNGFRVIMVDFRGYGKSTGTPTHVNIAKDATVFFNVIVKDSLINRGKLICYGASMGTQIASFLTKIKTPQIDALILDGTISSFTDLALHASPSIMHVVIKNYVTSPYSAKKDVQEISGVPLLLIHGKKDESIPLEMAEEVFKNANQPKELWLYEGGHLEATTEHTEELVGKIAALVKN